MSNNNNSLLDMSLDDLIKTNKRSGGRSSSRNNNSGSAPGGPARRPRNSAGNRSTPYSTTPAKPWLFEDGSPNAGGSRSSSAIETGTKLYISNLDYGVSNEDIKELFSEVGDLKRYSVDYDRSGRSEGTAEVVYSRRADALLALKKYNNIQLDGKAMKIEIAGTNVATPAVLPPLAYGMFGNSNGFNRRPKPLAALRVFILSICSLLHPPYGNDHVIREGKMDITRRSMVLPVACFGELDSWQDHGVAMHPNSTPSTVLYLLSRWSLVEVVLIQLNFISSQYLA